MKFCSSVFVCICTMGFGRVDLESLKAKSLIITIISYKELINDQVMISWKAPRADFKPPSKIPQ